MQDPTTYQQVNTVQSKDVELILNEFPIEWKNTKVRVLDVGCGDGSVTMNIWRKYIPENFSEIIGCDKSEKSVEFANQHYASERVKFIKLDIEANAPGELRESFDHVISSYTLHWVHRQRDAFSNIYDLLVKSGSCLIIFLGYVDVYEYYRKLSLTSKWKEDLRDIETKFVSPYQDCEDPQKEIHNLMQTIGYQAINIKVYNKKFNFENGVDGFSMLMKSLNPFEGLRDKWDDFIADYVTLNPDAGTYVYKLIVVYGEK